MTALGAAAYRAIRWACAILFPLVLIAAHVHAADLITGRATVINGDTIEIHGTRIRLYGIDAPEARQTCRVKGETWRCGQQAALALADKIGNRPVTCQAKNKDIYSRVVAVCHADIYDLGAWMVGQGWAMADRRFSTDYIGQEDGARSVRQGIWQGEVVPPWDWRHGVRLKTSATPQGLDCQIKGNINRRGERIYHLLGGLYYDRTQIDTTRGERWFCTEAEARAAGWRRSRR